MGQYYIAVFLCPFDNTIIRNWIEPHNFLYTGSKLTEHSYYDVEFVQCVEYLLTPNSPFYKTCLVWAGDYADKEIDSNKNLYHMCISIPPSGREQFLPTSISKTYYRYILNHSKKLYVDKDMAKLQSDFHPLPILTCDGNGAGGGDYRGSYNHVGSWARDIISVENSVPEDYKLLIFDAKD